MAMVTLKDSSIVKPAGKTPSGVMFIPDNDQFISISHVPTIYFYHPPPNQELIANAPETLKHSLSKVLEIFYPLAGRLQWIAGRNRLELDCNAMGALFIEADSDSKIEDFGDFSSTLEARSPLMPSVDYDQPIHEMPLLLVQLTRFSCGGISLALGVCHVIADGQSSLHFVDEWTRIARGEEPRNFPFLDRTILMPNRGDEEETLQADLPRFDHSEFGEVPLLIGQSDSLEERKKESVIAILKLTKEQIEKLKNKANENNHANRPFTRYEAVCAHMWRCASKARQHKKEQQTTLRITVDFRNRIEPPLPKWYYGNTVLPMLATATSGDLLSKPLAYASGRIRETIEMVTDEYVRSALFFLGREPDFAKFQQHLHRVGSAQGAYHGNPNMSITSWITLPVYGADFGWGKEVYMGPGGVLGYDGKSIILSGRQEDGSFVIALRLQVAHFDDFNKFFYEDII